MIQKLTLNLRRYRRIAVKSISTFQSVMMAKPGEGTRPISDLPVEKLVVTEGSSHIAYRRFSPPIPAKNIGVMFFQGLMSNMNGSKARYLEKYCRERNLSYICFDYEGHGESRGRFEDFSIGLWKQNALSVLNQLTSGPQIIVGSSIGAWIMLLTALEMPSRINSLIGIASAPDYMHQRYASLSEAEKSDLNEKGYFPIASEYSDEPYRIPMETIHEASEHVLLDKPCLPIMCPMRLIHGMKDETVPYNLSLRLAEKVESTDVNVHLIKDGDHRLSKPRYLDYLSDVLDKLIFKSY